MDTEGNTASRVDSAAEVLSGKLKDLLAQKDKGVIQLESDSKVVAAARTMRDNKVGAVMVLDNGVLVGIFTERDLMSRVVADGLDPENVMVSEVMTSSIATVPLETPIREAANLMSQNRIRHLPVLQDGQLVGVISAGDILAWKLREHEFTLHQLEDYFFKS
ncbi:MAG: CBS domain-containing protein [SAR324 cluster bacterium]|nr:CBS domain-containing protein [SAR324 cluster bacterium]MBL7035931.1 CBS domain-containing protein [SAR324 cluster bacterium]